MIDKRSATSLTQAEGELPVEYIEDSNERAFMDAFEAFWKWPIGAPEPTVLWYDQKLRSVREMPISLALALCEKVEDNVRELKWMDDSDPEPRPATYQEVAGELSRRISERLGAFEDMPF